MITLVCSQGIRPGYVIYFVKGESVSVNIGALLRNEYIMKQVEGKILVAPESYGDTEYILGKQGRLA
tara:strand:- start:816 stop:1016 length:201 start_codon:yes stop_codon:yes gene_type:complete